MNRLEGKVAAITGGASGIGAATVRGFVAEGAKVLVADLDQAKGRALADELGPATAFLRTDVSKEEDVAAMIAETTDRFADRRPVQQRRLRRRARADRVDHGRRLRPHDGRAAEERLPRN